MKLVYANAVRIYGFIMLSIIPISFLAKVLVGAAGHNSNFTIEDYVAFGFILITLFLLAVVYYVPVTSSLMRKLFCYATAACVLTTIYFGTNFLLSMINESAFSLIENIMVITNCLFLVSGVVLIWGLFKNKLYRQL